MSTSHAKPLRWRVMCPTLSNPHEFIFSNETACSLAHLGSQLHFRIRFIQPAIKVRGQKQWALLLLGEPFPPMTPLLLDCDVHLPLGQPVRRLGEKAAESELLSCTDCTCAGVASQSSCTGVSPSFIPASTSHDKWRTLSTEGYWKEQQYLFLTSHSASMGMPCF